MKATGIVRKVDQLGRVVLPIELRRTLNIELEDPIEIFTSDEHIILKRYQPACLFCDNADDLVLFNGKKVCRDCISKLNCEAAAQL